MVNRLEEVRELGSETWGRIGDRRFQIYRHSGEVYLSEFMLKVGLRFCEYSGVTYRAYKSQM